MPFSRVERAVPEGAHGAGDNMPEHEIAEDRPFTGTWALLKKWSPFSRKRSACATVSPRTFVDALQRPMMSRSMRKPHKVPRGAAWECGALLKAARHPMMVSRMGTTKAFSAYPAPCWAKIFSNLSYVMLPPVMTTTTFFPASRSRILYAAAKAAAPATSARLCV